MVNNWRRLILNRFLSRKEQDPKLNYEKDISVQETKRWSEGISEWGELLENDLREMVCELVLYTDSFSIFTLASHVDLGSRRSLIQPSNHPSTHPSVQVLGGVSRPFRWFTNHPDQTAELLLWTSLPLFQVESSLKSYIWRRSDHEPATDDELSIWCWDKQPPRTFRHLETKLRKTWTPPLAAATHPRTIQEEPCQCRPEGPGMMTGTKWHHLQNFGKNWNVNLLFPSNAEPYRLLFQMRHLWGFRVQFEFDVNNSKVFATSSVLLCSCCGALSSTPD